MTLFIDDDKKAYSAKDIQESLKAVGAHDGEVIFLHSDISFGRLASGLKPKEYLGELKNCFDNVGIENLVVPTFTYSFANNETFDVRNSKTYMGAFNEYLRNTMGGGVLSHSRPAAFALCAKIIAKRL